VTAVRIVLVIGYVFLYAPIVSLIVFSFNASRLVTVWAGFSTRWYGELWHNEAIRGWGRRRASRWRAIAGFAAGSPSWRW
jgi:ABC-type spermidine/putrescine transport system permease subunit II